MHAILHNRFKGLCEKAEKQCVCAFSNMEDFFEKFPTSKNVNDFPRVNRAYISF